MHIERREFQIARTETRPVYVCDDPDCNWEDESVYAAEQHEAQVHAVKEAVNINAGPHGHVDFLRFDSEADFKKYARWKELADDWDSIWLGPGWYGEFPDERHDCVTLMHASLVRGMWRKQVKELTEGEAALNKLLNPMCEFEDCWLDVVEGKMFCKDHTPK